MEPLILHLAYFIVLNLAVVLIGYWFVRNTMIWQSWVLMILSIYIVHIVFLGEHAIIRMLALIATTFTGMKVIATAEGYKGKPKRLSFRKWAVFAIGWAGMRAQPFETLGDKALPDAWSKIKYGISRVIAGAALIFLAHQLARLSFDPYVLYLLITAILLLAFSLILHFGLLSISAG
ncbi:MAG: hypothetical protein EOO88_40655, partial [Pedobacter sp.]